MNILVTGGAGFLGSHIADELIKMGHSVDVLDDLSGGFKDNIPKEAGFIREDITDANAVDHIFANRTYDYVFHLAAYAAEGLSSFIKRYNYTVNLMGSINLINASINNDVECFIFASSIAVYGSNPQLPLKETDPYNPEDSYGISKMAVEYELMVSKEFFDLNYIIFRPHNVYGERQNIGDAYRNVVGIFMNQILQDKPMTIYGDGKQSRAFSYIGDVAPVMAQAASDSRAYNQIFNVGTSNPYSVKRLGEKVAIAMGVEPRFEYLPERNEVTHAYSSHIKMHQYFKAPEPTSLEKGLARTAAWVKEHGARESEKFTGIEIRKNFPMAWKRYLE
jgi:UDP-glucose 4-epimerase